MSRLQRIVLIVACLSLALLPLRAQQDETLGELLSQSTEFEDLTAAIVAAGLGDDLGAGGPFTIFAPTDAAFAAALDSLGITFSKLAGQPGLLVDLLTYHIVEGSVFAEDVVALDGETLAMLSGETITISVTDGAVQLNDDANVLTTDIEVSDGVIHVIDSVLLPPALLEADLTELVATEDEDTSETVDAADTGGTIVDIAARGANLTTLVEALQATGLDETLRGDGPFTVFAPTDAAFDAALAAQGLDLIADTDVLAEILTYHVVEGQLLAEDLVAMDGMDLATVNGATISISTENGLTLNGSTEVVVPDVGTSNGVIHIIDSVLLPPSGE